MIAKRFGSWVFVTDCHGREVQVIVIADISALEDRGSYTRVFLKSGDELKVHVPLDDLSYAAFTQGVAVGLNITAGQPTEQT